MVTLREWIRVSGLVDAEQLRCQVQLVEEGQENMGRSDKDGLLRERRVSKDLARDRLAWKSIF